MRIEGYDFTIGADPEIFVKKDGKAVSAYGLVPGTKERPYKVKNGSVQVDGMALEFNIDPADNLEGFTANIDAVMKQLKEMTPGYEFLIEPVADFGIDYIAKQPKEAAELGCNPDFNAYTGKPNPRPDALMPFRTASGHIHIGWTKDVDPLDPGHFDACVLLTKALDIELGLPALLWEQDLRRKELYGKAGAFRPKSYGMEYRVLSNKFLNYPKLIPYVFRKTEEAIKRAFSYGEKLHTFKISGKKVDDLINNFKGWENTSEEEKHLFDLIYSSVTKTPKAYG